MSTVLKAIHRNNEFTSAGGAIGWLCDVAEDGRNWTMTGENINMTQTVRIARCEPSHNEYIILTFVDLGPGEKKSETFTVANSSNFFITMFFDPASQQFVVANSDQDFSSHGVVTDSSLRIDWGILGTNTPTHQLTHFLTLTW